jgi:hypothetical protein
MSDSTNDVPDYIEYEVTVLFNWRRGEYRSGWKPQIGTFVLATTLWNERLNRHEYDLGIVIAAEVARERTNDATDTYAGEILAEATNEQMLCANALQDHDKAALEAARQATAQLCHIGKVFAPGLHWVGAECQFDGCTIYLYYTLDDAGNLPFGVIAPLVWRKLGCPEGVQVLLVRYGAGGVCACSDCLKPGAPRGWRGSEISEKHSFSTPLSSSQEELTPA